MKILISIFLMFFSIVAPTVATEKTCGKELQQTRREAAWSPDKRYKVENIPFENRLRDGHIGHLYLVHNGIRRRLSRLPIKLEDTNGYDHVVEVLWAPNSRAFAINLWDPGRTACSYLYDINDLGHRVDIVKVLGQLIKDKKQRRVFSGITNRGPVFIATRWINSNWLELHIEDAKVGDNGQVCESFFLTYRWNLKDKLIFEPEKGSKTYLLPSCDGQ